MKCNTSISKSIHLSICALSETKITSGSIVRQITRYTQGTTDTRVCDEEIGRSLNNVIGGKLIKGNRQIASRELNTSAVSEVTPSAGSSSEEICGPLNNVVSVKLTKLSTQSQKVTSIIISSGNTCAATDQCSNTIINSLISEVEIANAFCQSICIVVADITNL